MKKHLYSIAIFIFILATYYSYVSQTPSVKNETTNTEFSTEKAFVHLKQITKAPHYVGTLEHARVRNYVKAELEKLGLFVEIQEQVAFSEKYGIGIKTQNIIARIKGKSNGKALLLLSHYDSAPKSSFGASDDGAGVVTILEGVRAFLAQKKEFENDIIILITDAEEQGLLGAKAFVKHHRWIKDVGLVINFEARGSGGASYLLIETNGGNKKMITEFAKANAEVPVGNSLMYSIYKMLPNDMDMTVFKEDGNIEGFNFAFIDEFYNYHMASDNYENIDPETVAHQGTYLMAILDHFSNADLSNLKSETDNVYFNFPVLGMVYYPFAIIIPMFAIAIILFIALVVFGVKRSMLSTKKMLKGFIPFLVILIGVPVIIGLAWQAILLIHPQYKDILHGFTYNGYYYLGAFSFFALGIAFIVYHKYAKKIEVTNLMVAPLFFWIVFSGLVGFYLKGAAFFIIPVYFNLAIFALFIFSKKTMLKVIIATLFSLSVIFIFAPLVQMFAVGLGLIILPVSMLIIGLVVGMLLPILVDFEYKKALSYGFLSLGVILLIGATLQAGYTKDRMKPNTLVYMLDVANAKAYWGSFDKNLDEWTRTYIGNGEVLENIDTTILKGRFFRRLKLYKEAEFKHFESSIIRIDTDTIINANRKLNVKISPQRKIGLIQLMANEDIEFSRLFINGESLITNSEKGIYLLQKGRSLLYYISKNEILELDIEVADNVKPSFTVFEISQDLLINKDLGVKPRPEKMTPASFYATDAIVTVKKLEL